jgi:hypothetical protein
LSSKLHNFGFSNPLLFWFRSFLSDRSQIFKHLNFYSPKFNVSSGVPQGHHLSTLLFNFFINDLPNVIIKSEIFLFADDTKLLKIIITDQDTLDLQTDFNNLQT